MTGIGHWRIDGVKEIIRAIDGRVVATRERFVFYLGSDSDAAAKTSWIMYEYDLISHPQVCSSFFIVYKFGQ